jgi:ElaB/YqjD/DUF883 family membrane-anchored ribosome-binding protein
MRKRVTTDTLIADLRAVADDAEALLKETSAQTGEKIQNVRKRAEKSLHQARKRLSEVEADALKQAHNAATNAEAYVHENPWQSLGVAAGFGFILGLLINRQ